MRADEVTIPARSRLVAIDGTDITALDTGWQMAGLTPGACAHPAGLAAIVSEHDWLPASVPGTAAGALRAAGMLDWEHIPDIDGRDWWFVCRFAAPSHADGRCRMLRFDGLATIADVWLNGHAVLTSESMWLAHDVDATSLLKDDNELAIRCASLTAALAPRRARPRWRTRIVDQQQLRWFRTGLLGRMPGWTPGVPAAGPWRGIALETRGAVALQNVTLHPTLAGSEGMLDVTVLLAVASGVRVLRATALSGASTLPLSILPAPDAPNAVTLTGRLTIPNVEQWWPHTHGAPALHEVTLSVETDVGVHDATLGCVGFREIVADAGKDGQGFALRINGVPIFARGACWAPLDVVTFSAGGDAIRTALMQARAAGFNMLRIVGATAYESTAFYDLCDQLGILVWQDFMFANMDYPASDPHFAELVHQEATQLLGRLAHRPSLAVLCGGSEVAQQAAMLGLPSDAWSGALYNELLPERCAALAPGVPYVANSPTGGALPFVSNSGVAHYYGVGAYLRPIEDARRAAVRFAAECLGFANVPEPQTVELVVGPTEPAPHHPRWKARVPRDRGAGWDFDDVRDHYFRLTFGLDPFVVRYASVERYLALSRVVSGLVMERTIAEWRRPDSGCAGALIWMHRDLWPGAGWGVVDSMGIPKAAYWFLARACAPVAIFATDEGVNGVALHVVNDKHVPLEAEVAVTLWRDQGRVAEASQVVSVAAHAGETIGADAILGRFTDVGYAYRFGPPGHDVVVATLRDPVTHAVLSDAFHFPLGMPGETRGQIQVVAEVWPGPGDEWILGVRSDALAIAVALDIPGFIPSDAYFHIEAGSEKQITLLRTGTVSRPAGTVHPLNAEQPTRIVVRA